ncbi:Di-copper centre-containing protein [Ceratobasidium sp. AG-I]|nr:Di-copper centre-containing protein [Ceratobasidium sp. AG-I]
MRTNALISLIACAAAIAGVGAAPTADGSLDSNMNAQKSAKCKKPEIRREWRTFSKKEKAAYIAAVNCLAKKPHSKLLKPSYPRANIPNVTTASSFYDDMTYIHMDLTDHIHYTGYFLPWHRWYTNQHVTQLKLQCGYTGVMPYWDWSKDAASFNTSAVWDADPTSGLGTFGDPAKDYYVTNGGFSKMQVAYPIKRNIRRQYTPFPYLTWWWVPRPTEGAAVGLQQSYVDEAINGYDGDFVGFQNATEKAQAFHANVHMILGGDMAGTCPTAAGSTCIGGSTWTPNDPMFFLHHANFDRIWWRWQWRAPSKNLFAFKGGSVSTYTDPAYPNGYPPWMNITDLLPTDGLFPQKSILSMMNTLGDELCYVYV